MYNTSLYPKYFREALFTDLYELTMGQAYDKTDMRQNAVFELVYRKLPERRKYVVAAGLDDVLDYLENLHFKEDDLDFLKRDGHLSKKYIDYLKDFHFTGDVFAVPEGTIVFPYEPVLYISAPIMEAQLVETFVLNQVNIQSLIATKTARVITSAAGKTVVDFGSRRAHGIDAALKTARVSYLAGAAGTSNLLAAKIYGIPAYGTMAHSYIQAHEHEEEAFKSFVALYPESTLLVDTYDTIQGVNNVIKLAFEMGNKFMIRAVRLDSGNLGKLSFQARQMLDAAGLGHVKIFASGNLDEYEILNLANMGAPIDGFGVGTRLAVSSDAPELDFVYKLVEYAGEPRIKLSTGKIIYPCRKQVFRKTEKEVFTGDIIARCEEKLEGNPLLHQVMTAGKRLPAGDISLAASRQYAMEEISRLPESLRSLDPASDIYPVKFSDKLIEKLDFLREMRFKSVDSR